MKRKSEMDSKAGTSPTVKNKMFKNVISKSASVLLVTMIGLSTMSFVQDDSFVSGSDTNQSAAKVQNIATIKAEPGNETCCIATVANPGDGINTAFVISTPTKKAMYKADKETIVTFISEVKERRIWSLNRAQAIAKADKDMHFNFKLSAIYPSATMAAKADKVVIGRFVDEIVHLAAHNGNTIAGADAEMAANFIAANLQVKVAKPTVELISKADAEILSSFKKATNTVISVPSAAAAQKADLEMMQSYKGQQTLTALK
ncbi:MAG TPA: hypothetical protein PKV73_19875 [Agriterribacter sp.]|nr:hypothetical protein [Agriterribacter sp.]